MTFRSILTALFLVSFAAPGVAVADDSAPRTTSLEEVLKLASENAAVLDEYTAKMEKARWQKYRADWAWGPKVQSDTTFAPVPANADPDSFGNNLDELAGLNIGPYIRERFRIVVPVYTFGRIKIAQALAEIGVDTAQLERDRAARDVEYQVKRAYYSAQLSNSFAGLLGEGSELIKEKLAEMEEAREFGEADFDTKDFRKLQVFDAEIDSRVLDNEKLAHVADAGLRYFSGYEGELAVGSLSEDSELDELRDAEAYIRLAEQRRPDLALLKHAVDARELQLALARRAFWPNVFLAGELGAGWSTEELALRRVCRVPSPGSECIETDDLFSQPYSNPLNFFSVGIALGIRWDFDFWQQRGEFREVRAQNDEVLAQRRRARGAIELEIRKLWSDAHAALEKVSVTRRRLDAARRWRDQFGLSMQSGGGDMKDAVDPLKAYYEARALHLQARYEYLVARAGLAQAVGLSELPPPSVNESGAGALKE